MTYPRLDDCPSHDAIEPIDELPWSVATATAGEFLERVRADLGPAAVVDFNHDLLSIAHLRAVQPDATRCWRRSAR